MSFNHDHTKQTHKNVFSCIRSETHHPLLVINSVLVKRVYFISILDFKLDFNENINAALSKVNKMIDLFQKVQYILPQHFLLTIYKTSVRPHLNYGGAKY